MKMPLRLQAALHEIRCQQCRVTWISWLQRLIGDKRGMSPRAKGVSGRA
jgi:phage baseplate assembly protein gpV